MKLYNGDCLETMKTLPSESYTACVTDPPYGLSNQITGDKFIELLKYWTGEKEDFKTSKGFMSKTWDSLVPHPNIWKEVSRILKPGGYCLVFAGTRTVDLMGMSLRLAGFELIDEISWCYGSGFPKSLDIGKAIDKHFKAEREIVGIKENNPSRFIKYKEQDGYRRNFSNDNITKPSTEQAKIWEGYKTCLKPSHEPILICRKPIDGNFVNNALKHGCGAFNIDECRVELNNEVIIKYDNGDYENSDKRTCLNKGLKDIKYWENKKGRYPSNLIIEDCPEVASMFPYTKTGGAAKTRTVKDNFFKGKKPFIGNDWNGGDEGSASRYFKKCPIDDDDYLPIFYSSKASPKERNIGLDGFVEKEAKSTNFYDLPRENGTNRNITKKRNSHPTVKPISLIQYLVKLVKQPENNQIIDPFMGSGTTGIACKKEGIEFTGIEMESEYFEIAKARIENYTDKSTPKSANIEQMEITPDKIFSAEKKSQKNQLELFG